MMRMGFHKLCLVTLITLQSTTAMQTITDSYNFENSSSQLTISLRSLGTKENFAYALCKPYTITNRGKEKYCDFFMKWYDVRNPLDLRMANCSLNFLVDSQTNVDNSTIQIFWTLLDEVTVVSWQHIHYEQDLINFAQVGVLLGNLCHIGDSTTLTYTRHDGMNEMVNGGFVTTVEYCNGQIRRIRIGLKGKKPTAWYTKLNNDSVIINEMLFIHHEGFQFIIVETLRDELTRFSILQDSDKVEHKDFEGTTRVNMSLNGGYIGICMPSKNLSLDCGLYDAKLNEKIKTFIELDYKPTYGAMHNFADGGFLLLTANCTDNSCSNDTDRFDLKRIDSEGYVAASYRFNDLYCRDFDNSSGVLLQLYENVREKPCLSRLCFSRDKYHVTVRCMDRKELGYFYM